MASISPVTSTSLFAPLLTYPAPVRSRGLTVYAAQSPSQAANTLAVDDVVDLSPLAQRFLDRFNDRDTVASNDNASSKLFDFNLSNEQADKIATIIADHQGEPQSQDTYNKIIADLTNEGLAPESVALSTVAQNPFLIDPTEALFAGDEVGDGDYFPDTATNPVAPDQETIQSTADLYRLQIYSQFMGISLI